ncbi:MAG TPA: triple tyrosine motif-containing protein [Flavobacterium sp.]|uniref:helix-turn-helix and ligand-binding sensor domain-containing protein n=1 Tax=Flavobacterium sp. TaxID=239 RepID=UPI002DB68FDC|nr:triple tyrosine motif-containing protein [Flavobacterium sp.]HEU4791219.1 triple tyrosine motif-containing protein [Flavobacterium sp.]
MAHNKYQYIKLTGFFLLLILTNLPYTSLGQVKKIGLPHIKNFSRTEYKGGTQNWNIEQDKNGNLYFANNNGLLQFDGSAWTKYPMPNVTFVRCLKIDASGRIFVGGYNEFGYFKPNSKGKLEYFSVSKLIKRDNPKIIDNIWKIHFYKGAVFFQSFKTTYIFKNNKVKILEAPNKFQFSFQVNDHLYFQDLSMGLMKYSNGQLIPLKGTTFLNDTEIWGMFAMPNNKILIATLDKGLYLYNNESMVPWETEANQFVKKNSCLGGSIIQNNYIVLNSILNGIIICDSNGRIVQQINHKKGIQNNTVLTSFVDSKSNLWLGLDNGITFINENSPFTYFGSSFDLSTVYASVVYKGNLYVATNQGLFYHSWDHTFKEDTFKLVEGTTGQAWNIQVIDGELLCAHNRGALLIEGSKSFKTLDNVGYWIFKQIPNHPNYLIGSNYNGFSIFEKKTNGWQFRNKVGGLIKSIGEFELDDKSIWIKKDNLIQQLTLTKDLKQFKTIKTYQNLTNKATGIGSIQQLRNKIYFQTNNQFFKFSYEQELFFEDKMITRLFKNIPKVSTIREDSQGNIWYVYNESLGVLMKNKDDSYKNSAAPFSNLTGNLVYNYLSINAINSENILIGLTDGLAHYDSKLLNNFATKPKAFVRTFTFPGNTYILGNGQKAIEQYEIPYSSNQVKFTFSSPIYENLENVEFSYQLVGFDENWSPWSNSWTKEYTNLKEGNYTMKVKVRNSYGIQSDETSIAFRVYPPWYRHSLAYLFYLLMAAGCVYYVRFRIRIKIRKNKHFETLEQRRLYLEKETKIKQEQYELEKEIEKLENEKLQIKILTKDKELVNNTLQVVKKNKILNGIIHKLKDINTNSFDETTKAQFTKLNRSITKEVNTDKSWKDLEKHLKNVHFDFLKKLKEKHPTISPREMDLATYLLMNMSTKEIAEFMNISTGGVELARYRLRKKLELNQKENLIGYLMSIK